MVERRHLFVNELKKLFDLRSDMDTPEEIENSIEQGIHIRGTNLWILMFAIFVASIGLNVNSTAVIIGAMLISPLMGPIMGIGYAAGVGNYPLIRKSIRTLGVFVTLSLITSTLYFSLTPLSQAQSELMARTSPTLWDVLIALFGGMAGIIGVTRREWGNVIPGVAIATALMPPLCTAGYGLATGEPKFFFGAFYLFTINAVYIALSALIFTRLLRLPRASYESPTSQRKLRLLISSAIIVTLVPSGYLGLLLVKNEMFNSEANAYIASISNSEKNLFVVQTKTDPKNREITLVVTGKAPEKAMMERLNAQLSQYHLSDAKLVVRGFQQDNGADMNLLKTQLQEDLYRNNLQLLEAKNAKIQELEDVIRNLKGTQQKQAERQDEYEQARMELAALYPEFQRIYITHGKSTGQLSADPMKKPAGDVLVVYLEAKRMVTSATKKRITNWMKSRYKFESVYVLSVQV